MRNTNTILVFSATHRHLVDVLPSRAPHEWYSISGHNDYPFYVCEWNGTHELSASVWGLSTSVAGAVVAYFRKNPKVYKPDQIFPDRAKPYTVDRAPLLRVRIDIERKKMYFVTVGCSTFEVEGKKNLGKAIDKFLQCPEHHMRRFRASDRSRQGVPGFEDYGVKYNGRASLDTVSQPLPTEQDRGISRADFSRAAFINHLARAERMTVRDDLLPFLFVRPGN